MQEPALNCPILEPDDRALRAPFRHLVLGAIKLGVEHGMGAEAIGAALQKIRFAGFGNGLQGTPRRRLNSDHIHAIHRLGRDRITACLGGNIGLCLGQIQPCAHRIAIVFAHK